MDALYGDDTGSTFSSSRQRTQAPAAPTQYHTSSGAYRAGRMRPASALLIVVLSRALTLETVTTGSDKALGALSIRLGDCL